MFQLLERVKLPLTSLKLDLIVDHLRIKGPFGFTENVVRTITEKSKDIMNTQIMKLTDKDKDKVHI